MITKTKRYSFIFSEETDRLIKQLKEETKMKVATIFEESLKVFAEQKGIK